ncbi:MAG: hypothetical protein ABSC94_11355 [Polyangiaceae bacterium]
MPHPAAESREASEAETLRENMLDEAEVDEDEVAIGSIDHLLAITDPGWDVDDQVLTLQQAAATTQAAAEASAVSARAASRSAPARPSKGPPPLPRKGPPPLPQAAGHRPPSPASAAAEPAPTRAPVDVTQHDGLLDLLQARVAHLESRDDKIGLARTRLELSIATETILGDDRRAIVHAQAALRAAPDATAAHAILRRASHGRAFLPAMLEHLDRELQSASADQHRVQLLTERARLLEATGGRSEEVRAAWEQALEYAPNHAAALKGLEGELVARTVASGTAKDWEALAIHLGRMADAFKEDPKLAAWLHVERARILERRLDRVDGARGALDRALELDPSVGPVREALVRHVAAHADWGSLARLLDEEAALESDGSRAARLELDAAMIAAWKLGDRSRAHDLLERAASRAPTVPAVDRRVLDELVRLNETEARWSEAARARRARLRFVTDPSALAYELRALAGAAEKEADTETAIADVQRALSLDASDPSLVDWLDRLLSSAGKHEARIATWIQEAARTEDPSARARALVRAAHVCEALGRRADAVRHLRSAWVACPGDNDALDSLSRLLAPSVPETVEAGPRSVVELYSQAAEEEGDPGRKVVYLERVALLWEEVLGDPARSARAYQQVLAIEPDRRSALVGLQRSAARGGDDRTVARALLEEARVTSEGRHQLALQARAAAALAKFDPTRAIQLVRDVLEHDPTHASARELETRLYEDASRWELAAQSIRARIEAATTPQKKLALWLRLAQIQHVRLRAPHDALVSLERARALDPIHPVPAEEASRVLDAHGDARALRDALERLAANARSPAERARQLARAAEIDELRLDDDAGAARTYQRALAETPGDSWIAERLSRLLARRARKRGTTELAEQSILLAKRIDSAATPLQARALSFELACSLVDGSQEPLRATALLESLLAEEPSHVPALRTLESLLWNLAALEEWALPNADPSATYRAILKLDPADLAALDGTLRRELAGARRGDSAAKKAAVAALRALVPFASNDDARLALELRLALLLEAVALESQDPRASEDLLREALEWYRDALRMDATSVTSATSVARLAAQLLDTEGAIAAALSLADLADDPRIRARWLLDGAELLLGPDQDRRIGPVAERRRRAMALLERGLDADPDSIPIAGRLATILLEEQQGERLVSAFRAALLRARSPDAVVMFGSEVARVARSELNDLPVGIEAMRRVRSVAPQHVPSLLTLAELCIAQRVWPDAVDALEAVVSTSRDSAPKLTALFALASIYEKVLARPADVDRVLRAALAVEPSNVRALRALLRRLATEPTQLDEKGARARRGEIALLLDRLADAEPDLDVRSGILVELSEVHARLGDVRAAERALVVAIATSPVNGRAFARLAGLFRSEGRVDATGYARALGSVIALGEQTGRTDARWFAALGHLEIDALQRKVDGIVHLERAADLDPTLYGTRFELARALSDEKRHAEASAVLMGLISPTPHPILSLLEPPAALALLEHSLTAEHRGEEAVVASELRAIAGDLDDARLLWLRSRRLPPMDAAAHGVLDRPTLVNQVLPSAARHVLLEVAAAIAGAETRMLRSDLTDLGISARDRLSTRSAHPTRAILDRLARQLGVGDVELVVTPNATHTRVMIQDAPWIVVPSTLVELSESTQAVCLARALARIAFGVPWLEELSPAHVEALLIAAARQVVPGYGIDGKGTAAYETLLARSLTRKQRRLLEELLPHLSSTASEPPPIAEFIDALARAELRTAFLLTGDLSAVVDGSALRDVALREAVRSPGPRALAAVLDHPWIGDVVRFALSPEASALRRKIGSIGSR